MYDALYVNINRFSASLVKGVEPKRRALAEAQEELAATQIILDKARAKLAEVEEGLRSGVN